MRGDYFLAQKLLKHQFIVFVIKEAYSLTNIQEIEHIYYNEQKRTINQNRTKNFKDDLFDFLTAFICILLYSYFNYIPASHNRCKQRR